MKVILLYFLLYLASIRKTIFVFKCIYFSTKFSDFDNSFSYQLIPIKCVSGMSKYASAAVVCLKKVFQHKFLYQLGIGCQIS